MIVSRRTLVTALAAAPIAWPLWGQSGGTRPPSQFALDLCGKICRSVGLSQNFSVLSGDVEAAEARLVGNTRQIVYNEDWLRQVEIDAGSGVPATVVLAHEIGHHLNGHTLDAIPADVVPPDGLRFRLREELEADLFAGGITARLSYPLEAGLPAFAKTGEVATVSHPSRTERENHFKAGWVAVPQTSAGGTGPRAASGEIVNVYTHSLNAVRVQSQFRGEATVWTEYQNGTPFAQFEEVFRDPCKRILIYDRDRALWVRLTPSITGFGLGEFGTDQDASIDQIPGSWTTLDLEARGRSLVCNRGRLMSAG